MLTTCFPELQLLHVGMRPSLCLYPHALLRLSPQGICLVLRPRRLVLRLRRLGRWWLPHGSVQVGGQ